MSSKTLINVADFETTVIPNADNNVYSWALGVRRTKRQINKREHPFAIKEVKGIKYQEYKGITIYYGISIKSFINLCFSAKQKMQVYFVNLGGFDGHFIKDYLIKEGYWLHQDLVEDSKVYPKEHLQKRLKYLEDKYNKLWNPTIKWEDYVMKNWSRPQNEREWSFIWKNSKFKCIQLGMNIEFRDTLNLIKASVADMGNSLALEHNDYSGYWNKSKGVEHGGIKYNRTEMYKSVEELEKDGNELTYLFQDIFVPSEFLNYFLHEKLEEELNVEVQLTAGATAFKDWKECFRHKLFDICYQQKQVAKLSRGKIVYNYFDNRSKKWVSTKTAWKRVDYIFSQMFPSLPEEALILDMLRDAYRGGITQVNPKYQGKIVKVRHKDINSSYPSVMNNHNNLYPIGMPLEEKPEGDYVYIVEFTLNRDVFNHKGMPFIPTHNGFGKSAQYTKRVSALEINGTHRHLYLTDVEFKQFKKQYQVKEEDINVIKKTYFQALRGDVLFGDYYNKWYGLKEEAGHRGDKILKSIAKIFLNSLYGYWARRWNLLERYVNPMSGNKTDEDYEVQLDPIYLPIGIFITSYARMKLIKASEESWEEFGVYCDTDSIFAVDGFYWNPEEVKNDPDKLGYWDEDHDYDTMLPVRPKVYDLYNSETGKYETHIAGVDFNVPHDEAHSKNAVVDHLTFYNMLTGGCITYQMRPHRIYNGVWLEEYTKVQKAIWNAVPIADQEPRIKNKEELLGEYKEWEKTQKSSTISMTK